MSALTYNDFAEALVNQIDTSTRLTGGVDVFAYRLPDGIKRAALVLPPMTGVTHNHYLPQYREGRYMVMVRDTTHEQGFKLARSVEQGLTVHHAQLGNFQVNHIRSVHEPVRYPLSESGLIEFALHFDCNYVDQKGA